MIASDLAVVVPEVALVLYAMAALLWGVFVDQNRAGQALLWITSAVLLGVAVWICLAPSGTRLAFNGAFSDDPFSRFAKVMLLVSSAVVLFLSQDFLKREELLKFEFPVLTAFAALGMMVMVSASDLMVLYMGLELQSLSLYVLASFHRNNARSTEAGLKYFVLGALSSGLLLYGASLVYGYAGTTLFSGIEAAMSSGGYSVGLLYGLVFMIVGLAFKVTAAPFHMWAPDVYEGAPTPVTALFATAPKIAAMVLFARLLIEAFGHAVEDWSKIVAILAVLSMFLGAVAAIGQKNIKRLMAYSSIAHMGFALVGVAAGTQEGFQAMLVYLAIYATMNIGTFAFILSMRRGGQPVAEIADLHMYSRQAPLSALALLLLLFSLAGIVPLVGFFAKFYVFVAAIDAGMIWLAVAGALASVIGAYYYVRIVYFMYFGEQADALDDSFPQVGKTALVAAAALMLLGVVNLFGVDGFAESASAALFR